MISARDLTRSFGAGAVVDGVSFDVNPSEIVALLGPNGAGKTTTMRMLGGLIGPTRGSIVIDGQPLTRATGSTLRRRIGFLTEAPGLWDRLTVRENLRIYAGLYELPRPNDVVDRALETFGLTARSSMRAAELSKGLRQSVALARALLHEPSILLLDEPTSGLDPEVTRGVRHMLEERRAAGCAILVSTHNLDEAERVADRVAVLHRRLLALDRPAELRRRLTTGRIVVRVGGSPSAFAPVAAQFDQAAVVEGADLIVTLKDPDRQTPDLVRALIAAGADILEVRPEIPALEDVYLHLVANSGGRPS
jgi:ABC-2 type transport system ATP-binding protein